MALKHTKDNCFAISAPTSFTPGSLGAKVRFLNFYRVLQGRLKFTTLGNSLSYFKVNRIDGSDRNTSQLGCASGCKIKRKTSNKLPELNFSDSRTKVVSVFNIHLSKLTHSNNCFQNNSAGQEIDEVAQALCEVNYYRIAYSDFKAMMSHQTELAWYVIEDMYARKQRVERKLRTFLT